MGIYMGPSDPAIANANNLAEKYGALKKRSFLAGGTLGLFSILVAYEHHPLGAAFVLLSAAAGFGLSYRCKNKQRIESDRAQELKSAEHASILKKVRSGIHYI